MFWRSPSPSLSAPVPDVALVSFFCPLVRTVHPHTRFSTHHNNLFKCCSQFCPHLHSHYYKSNFWKRLDLSSHTASSMKPSWINITLEPLLSVPLAPHLHNIIYLFTFCTSYYNQRSTFVLLNTISPENWKTKDSVYFFPTRPVKAHFQHLTVTGTLDVILSSQFSFHVDERVRQKSCQLTVQHPCFHFSYRC